MKTTRRAQRALLAASLLGASFAGVVQQNARALPAIAECTHPVLVLSAMPLELNPLVNAASPLTGSVRDRDRTFYSGRIHGVDVVLAMTGIGLVNAEQTTTIAVEHFNDCPFRAVVFSGVAGSKYNIGDVAIPKTWKQAGHADITVNVGMFNAAKTLDGTKKVPLAQDVPVGDAACVCPGVDAATPVHMAGPMAVHVPDDPTPDFGISADTFSGHAVPCLPGGGDIAGCKPCVITSPGLGEDAAAFASNMPSIMNPEFFGGLFAFGPGDPEAASQDEETAAVAEVASNAHVPFLGVRAVSDGPGDPLGLPGFPVQFAVYRQLAGNNAATVTIAFLDAWAAGGYLTT